MTIDYHAHGRIAILLFVITIGTGAAAPSHYKAGQMQCAEYKAAGLNAPPETDSEYSDEDENTNENINANILSDVTAAPIHDSDGIATNSGVVKCLARQHYCFSVWKLDPTGNATIVRQGCWPSDDQQPACQNSHCISKSPNTVSNNHRFCCCSGSMCNQNTTIIVALHNPDNSNQIDDEVPLSIKPPLPIWRSPLVWVCFGVTSAMAISIGIFLVCSTTKKFEADSSSLSSPSGPGFSSNAQNVDNLKLSAMIGQGKYGTVWKGIVNEQEVAVKIFPSQHKQYFVNERNIYSLNLMDSPSLLEYFGSDTRRTMSDNIEYLLVLSLAPFGCLQDWLITNTCSFKVFTKMSKSIVRGLSHLHTEMKVDDMEKPCVCHRDLNTRNILVKADLSCCISDFGFALKMYGSRYEWKGEIASAETKSVNEVGTLRYMAPEVLEGAVNLRDCETALKQIDVYSLGLILWELATRCQDWFTVSDGPPPYQAPFEFETGKNPSFETMQILVSRHKARPIFPNNWGLLSASSRILQETCEDCWDHDAEARLTALCAEERVHELAILGPTAQYTRQTSPSICKFKSQQIFTGSCNDFEPPCHLVHNSMYHNNVTTAIITPPNQIIPLQRVTDEPNIPAKVINMYDYIPSERNVNNFGDEEGASIEELISCSTSCESMTLRTPTRGWYGVRSLINKNLFKKNPYKMHQRDQSGNECSSKSTVAVDPPQMTSVRPNALVGPAQTAHPRPSNLVLEHPNHELDEVFVKSALAATLPRVASVRHESTRAFQHSMENRSSLALCGSSTLRSPRIGISKSATTVLQPTENSLECIDADDIKLKRQRSLDMFREVFGAKGSVERLRDPSQRVKTPGDVPPSVRKIRASKTLSLYDDRMMDPTMVQDCL